MRHPGAMKARNTGMKRFLLVFSVAMLAGCSSPEKPARVPAEIAWQPWSDSAFETAKRENKLVLLDLGAVWCHWCHVMDRETYGDAEVAKYLGEHFVAIHVNQDERPDLANHYEDYGWPATILFAADGTELGKFRGFMSPDRLLALLKAFVADPTPGPSAMQSAQAVIPGPSTLSRELDDALHEKWEAAYDHKEQGWGTVHKYLDPDCVELAMAEGRDDMARGTLDAMLGLIDPVWGGVYQYSDGGVWTNPHFEKIMSYQAEDLRIFALAYRVFGDEKYLKAARDIERYLLTFLRSPEGAFYASQDADLVPGEHAGEYFSLGDAERRTKGIPRVDKHLYTRENGWAIVGLVSLYHATGEASSLKAAITAAHWVLENRALPGGGFRHDESDSGGPYLADSLAMARAYFEISQATRVPEWKTLSILALADLNRLFRVSSGYATAAVSTESAGKPWAPRPQTDENIGIARLAIRWHHLVGPPDPRDAADHANSHLAAVARDASGVRAAGLLLAARELASTPAIVVVVGDWEDPSTQALLRAAESAPSPYFVIQRVDPGASEEYVLDGNSPTAYVCTDAACNGPYHDPAALRQAVSPPRRR